jgi:hypothetical protein
MANGAVLTPTPLRNNSMGKANGSINNKHGSLNNHNNNNGNNRMNHEETDTPSGVNGLSDKGNLLSSSRLKDRKKVIASNCPMNAHYNSKRLASEGMVPVSLFIRVTMVGPPNPPFPRSQYRNKMIFSFDYSNGF